MDNEQSNLVLEQFHPLRHLNTLRFLNTPCILNTPHLPPEAEFPMHQAQEETLIQSQCLDTLLSAQ